MSVKPGNQSRKFGHNLKLLRSYLRRDLVCPGLPITAVIACSNQCNLNCLMCLRSVMDFPGPNTDFDLFKKIIDEGAPYFRYVSLDGPGEPLLNPETFRMIRYCKSLGIRVGFSTNATLLTDEINDDIFDSGLDHIIFSVNGTTQEVFKKYHRGADFEEVVGNIRRFIRRKIERQSSILVILQMIRLPDTQPQIKDFYRLWRIPGVDAVRVKADVVCIDGVCVEDRERRSPTHNRCARLWQGPIYMDYNGDIYPTPGVLYRAKPVGNIKNQSLKEIWNCKRIQDMRKAHIRRDFSGIPECAACGYPKPRLPLILGSFLLDPFQTGKLIPWIEKLSFFHRLPLFEKNVLSK